MAAPGKQTSRWGSFLQQALDGVESRLDNILVGDGPVEQTIGTAPVAKSEQGSSRSASATSSTNDRLQERLARAIAAKKYAVQRPESHNSSNVPSRVGSPVTTTETPRKSLDTLSVGSEDAGGDQKQKLSQDSPEVQRDESRSASVSQRANNKDAANGLSPKIGTVESPHPSTESTSSNTGRPSGDLPSDISEVIASTSAGEHTLEGSFGERAGMATTENETLSKQQQNDLGVSDLQRQEEIHFYIERIDALQAKLQYLSRESTEGARKAAAAASGSLEKKIAEKDEQIALLMEEGQKLSKTELKHMTIIKKLRANAAESEKDIIDFKKKLEKAEKEKTVLSERLRKAEAIERQSTDRQKILAQLQKDNEAISAGNDAKDQVIAELNARLLECTSQAKVNEVKAIQEQLELEKSRVAELEDDILSLKVEKELAAGRAKAQLEELRAKSDREVERARMAEVEMRAEQQMLESKLELMRTHAEEVSSGATSDAQVKLLRQIETLQTQYAVASENWQGIEASLVTRVTSLEKERDEALKRELDTRRRAREATMKSGQTEDELEGARIKMRAFQSELDEQKEWCGKLLRRAEEAESALIEARKALEQEKLSWKSDIQHRVDEDRSKWKEDLTPQSPFGLSCAESPVPSSHRNLTADLLGLQNLQTRTPTRSLMNDLTANEGRMSRKSSTQHARSLGQGTPQRQESAQSIPNGESSELPSINAVENDDYFEHALSPSPTHQTVPDVLSVSTVGAGPSVQLVERMSAAVRRLESEKVSAKEELRRLSGQRDEARAHIVTLLQEVAAKKALELRLQELEKENKKINARYQTTLEMLGEKSELVEELRADVQDVKDMYRELVERTVK